MPDIPLAVIIPTFNEEANIRHAVASVLGWARQVFVVDSYSTDRTVDIVLDFADERIQTVQHPFENYSAQWNWAISRLPITQPWVMKLDADERATAAFRDEVAAVLAQDDVTAAAYLVHWKLIFMGRWLRWGGLYPNGNVRIWRHGKARFENRDVNEHVLVDGLVGEITEPLEHHDYKSLSHWLDRHNRYSSMEARAQLGNNLVGEVRPRLLGRSDQRRMWLRQLYYRIPARAFWYFIYRYLVRLGFLDGRAGFRFAFLHAAFLYWIDLKTREYRQTGVLPEVTWPARGEPHPAVRNSPLQQLADGDQRSESDLPPSAPLAA